MVRVPLLVALLVGMAGLSMAPARMADEPDIVGVYQCEGVNPNGRPYRGFVEILKTRDSFHVKWTLAQNNISLGVGLVTNNVLAVSYYGNAIAGVIVYKIEAGKLIGQWTIAGTNGSVYTETLTRLPPGAPGPPNRETAPNDEREREPAPRPAPRPVQPRGGDQPPRQI